MRIEEIERLVTEIEMLKFVLCAVLSNSKNNNKKEDEYEGNSTCNSTCCSGNLGVNFLSYIIR